MNATTEMILRAGGCLLGQLAGDSLGGLVEFQSPEEISRRYPDGVCELADGGTWGTIAGQPTDDSEMALALARMLMRCKRYGANEARNAYLTWLNSSPFDCGSTVAAGLRGRPNPQSQANGALMRISPLGIFCWNLDRQRTAECAQMDAAITHPHPVCLQTNALLTIAISEAVAQSKSRRQIYESIKAYAGEMNVDGTLLKATLDAADRKPVDYIHQQGWVLIAFQNALWQLRHADSLEEGVVDTVMQGGDTDTNAAIAGALLGAVYGKDAVPAQWIDKLLNCCPMVDQPNVRHPRPECYWPVDALDIARCLVTGCEA